MRARTCIVSKNSCVQVYRQHTQPSEQELKSTRTRTPSEVRRAEKHGAARNSKLRNA